jgi:4a-hydroxytetrahydrobiopterin dehydratase
MQLLSSEKCVACRRDSPHVTDEESKQFHAIVPEWDLIIEDEIPKLTRSFSFENFKDAMKFSNLIGAQAEEEGHHPRIITEYGNVRIFWWTHKIKNLHKNDFIMAAKTDSLYK